MTVYVLVTDSARNYAREEQVEVFQTKSQAQEAMWDYVQCAKDNGELEGLILEFNDDMDICYLEQGDYTRNHLEWTIYEREVEPDKELQQ